MPRVTLCAFVLAAVHTLPVCAMLTEINVTAVEPFAEGASFGDTGAYERVRSIGLNRPRRLRVQRSRSMAC